MGTGYKWEMAGRNAPIQVQQPLATSIYMGFTENAVKLISLQTPQLVELIGFLHLRRFPMGYHIRSAGECYPLQWDYMLLFNFSVTTQKCDIFTSHCVHSYSLHERARRKRNACQTLLTTFNDIWSLVSYLSLLLSNWIRAQGTITASQVSHLPLCYPCYCTSILAWRDFPAAKEHLTSMQLLVSLREHIYKTSRTRSTLKRG